MNPYIIIAALVGAIVLAAAGYFKGHHDGSLGVQMRWDKAVADQQAKEQAQANAASTKLESGNEKARVVYKTITQNVDKIVEKPVYRNICFDDGGMQLANQALTGSLAAPAQPDKPVSRPDAPTGRNISGGITQGG
jgi:hypothetical protein